MAISRAHMLRGCARLLACAILVCAVRADAQNQAMGSLNLPEVHSADVTPGDTSVTIPFEVSGADSIALHIIAPVAGAQFSLSDPAMGVVLTSADPSVTFVPGDAFAALTPLPGGMFYTEKVVLPANGTWTLTVSFPAAAELTVVVATVFTETDFMVGIVAAGDRFVAGQDVPIGLMVLNGGIPVAGVSPVISVTLDGPSGVPVLFSGMDDGVRADGLANDGIYSADVLFPQVGTYTVTGTVSIPDGANTVMRTASPVTIHISNPPMSAPTVSISTLNATGCFAGFRVNLNWQTMDSGEAVIRCYLRASNGKEITSGTTIPNVVSPSTESATVDFLGQDIKDDLGVDGPYTLSRVEIFLVKNETITLGSRGVNLMATDPVLLSAVCRSSNIEIGNPDDSSLGVALDVQTVVTNGFISSVMLNFPVFVTTAGTHAFSFKIVGKNNAEAFVLSQSVALQAGANDVVFEAAARGFLTVDGPYSLVSILVTGPSGAQNLTELGNPFVLSRWQFAPTIVGDLDDDGDVDGGDKTLLVETRGVAALNPGDRRNLNGDSVVDIRDARSIVTLQCATGACAGGARAESTQLTDIEELRRLQD